MEGNRIKNKKPVRLAFLGGFLGAGKTTALIELGKRLITDHGKRVVVVTNDQGEVLVDTKAMENSGFSATEVTKGCFCCRFSEFIGKCHMFIEELSPDIILAEPVGSCTDLISTIYNPISQYNRELEITPLIVLVDPYRAMGIPTHVLSEPSEFLTVHQIKEADILVINKIDLLSDKETEKTKSVLRDLNEEAEICCISAKERRGLDRVIDIILNESYKPKKAVNIDYLVYGRAEAFLGWFNGVCNLRAKREYNPYDFVKSFMVQCSKDFNEGDGEIAHFKVFFSSDRIHFKASVTSNTDGVKITEVADSRTGGGRIIVNARVGLDPLRIDEIVYKALSAETRKRGIEMIGWCTEKFRPSQPKPEHRMTEVSL